MTTAVEIKERKAQQDEDTWNVEALFPSLEAWEQHVTKLANEGPVRWPHLAAYQGRLGESAEVLKEALEANLNVAREIEKAHTYAHMQHDVDLTEDAHKGAYQRIMSLYHTFGQEMAWFEPELLKLPKDKVESYLLSEALAPYRFYLEKIFRMAPHTLSAEQEELIALAGKPLSTASKAFSALNNADLQFGEVEDSKGAQHPLTHGLYQLYLRSPDRLLRERSFHQMHGQFRAHENTLAELLSGQVESHLFQAKARTFPSCVEAALFPNKVPVTVYRALIDAVRSHIGSLHRYGEVRKKVMGVDTLHLYDMYAPMVQECDTHTPYHEAEKLVIESVAPLGNGYQEALRKGLKEHRWVDRYENKNKRSGAYSTGCFDSYPYILMNYRGTLRDVFTLAHEAGHSMHSYLSHQTQPYHTSHYPIFVAEVASTFNEELLMHLMLERTTDPKNRLFLINEKLEDIRATLFRQTMFAEFELKIHELAEANTPLTPTLLKTLYLELNRDYFGPHVEIDEAISIEWARIPHFYYNFYVYQYATGISAALSLVEHVLADKPGSKEHYLSFLSSGGSLFPIDLLKLAGVDVSTPEPVLAAIRTFDSLVSEFESLAL